MEKDQTVGILENAKFEIVSLRKQNELLNARMSGIDDCLALLFGKPGTKNEVGMSPDVVFDINKRIADLTGPGPQPGN